MLALALPLGAWLLPVAGGASAPVVRLPDAAEHCATSARLTVCSHADLGPEDPLSTTTAAVQARADALQDALQDAVLAEPSDAPDASSPLPVMHTAPGCTGDGVSGNRVQVVYALPTGRTDRFSSLKGDLVTFVARVDDVLQGSSALTGGDAAVRWVTDSSCALSVQKVPVSSAAETSFDTMTTELAAAGLTAKDRKYLVLVDTPLRGYCGIAQQYLDDQPASTNANNGRYPMFARVDTQCWGRPDHSTEAHELVHTLGAVQRSAPNSTAYGHCTDESDLMCYADGSGSVMRSVCAAAGEEYLDCRHDDYFSSNPSASSYLGTHWNTARSGFLTVPEPPTVTVAAVDEVRGSPFRLSATPVVRSGQTWTLGWHLPDGCTVTTDPSGTSGSCPATMTDPLTVSATVTQRDGQAVTVAAAVTTDGVAVPPAPTPTPTPTSSAAPTPTPTPTASTIPTSPIAAAPPAPTTTSPTTGTSGSPAPTIATVTALRRTTVSVALARSRVSSGHRVRVSGQVRLATSARPVAGARAVLQVRSRSGAWRTLVRTSAGSRGGLHARVAADALPRRARTAVLRWSVAPTTSTAGSVSPRARVTLLR